MEVGTGDDLNVDTTTYESDAKTTEDPLSVNDADQTIEVSVTGSDFADVSDATDTTLDFAEVNITSDQFTGDSQKSKTLGDGENVDSTSGPADFNNLNFEEGGEVLVEVTAEEREDGETTATYTYNETLTVEGDNIVDYSPSEVTAGETQDVTVQVANSEGNLVADRTITFTPDDGATASGDDVNTNTIELTSNNFDTSSDAYIAENVTFDTPGTFDVTVDDGGDPATTTVDTEEAITVTGEERYDVRTDDELLAGSGDDVTLEVYDISGDEEQLVNDSTELDELATNIELEQGGDAGVVTDDGTTTDAENGTITVSNLNAVGADAEPVNVTVSTPDDAFTGDGQINVVEPEITTNLNDEVLTEGVTAEDVEISVTDPRDGSAVDGDIRFTANGTDDDLIEFDINNTDTAAGANTVVTNGNQETIPLGSSGQANVTITPSAIEDAANATLVLDASPEADGNFYSASDVDAGNLQLFERENGQDVELRDEFAFDFDGEVTYVLRDADGDRLDNRDVTVRPSGTDNIDDTTEEGFFNVNYSNVDLEEGGTVAFDSASEFNGDITVATADVTQNLQEVELTASVESDSVVQGNDFNFSVIRSDFSEDTQADLAFVNASGDEVLSTGTGAVDTDGYGVVDSSDLETGDYTVEVSKDNSNGNTFLNDTVNVSVTERITDVSLDPSTVEANTTVEHDLQYTALGVSGDGNTDTLVATLPASASFADIDNATINVTDADGNEVSITGSPSLSDTNDGTNNQLQFDISPEQDIDATVDATFEVAFPDVNESTTEDITLEVQDSTEGTFTTTTPVTIQPADAEPVPTATVTFSDQTVTNGSDTVTVDSANLSEGGFVVIHAEDNGSAGAVLGNSSYLANGTSENITITLDEPLTANTSLVAMAHLDTDGDEAYEFDGGSVDAPYTEDGSAVVDTASITVETVEGPGDVTGNGEPAQDLNGDGVFEDVNGDGEYTVSDVQALFAALDDAEGELAFDINGDGQVTVSDVQALFAQL
ncbi:hypothetical protein C468_16979 [Halorubrum kocurii JCM 14978]|uniref:EF-hand domain-containing protein n=1 Tax=Halorubrum kocurii JCM 14978 TaxID=1230456 RepID=M0NJZ5_9EURY|nr:hypothetical protein C468_16979 [Halorubrum kocurii JCM 14978]